MRLFLDANVLFAACWSPDGRAGLLLGLARTHQIDLITSPHALEEARRNIERKRPDALPALEQLQGTVELVVEAAPAVVAWAGGRGLPDGDAPILAAAIANAADALVTGDATHFGHLYDIECRGVVVLRLADALQHALDR
jgi:uncharacterized protein